jgi:predicted  nucleic acid-binding Zn-ribbon protein
MEDKNTFTNPIPGQSPRPLITPKTGPLPPPRPPGSPLPPPTPSNNKSGTKTVLQVIIAVLSIALVAALVFIYTITKQSKEELELARIEREEVMMDLDKLKSDYGVLKTGNDTLSAQLDSERQKIDVLMERIKKTEATNRANVAKIRQYEREVNNLKSLLTGYVHQIDSLNTLNRALRAENTKVKSEMSQSKKQVEQLSQETTALKSIVEKGGELKTRDITVVALTNREKAATKARQTEQLKVCLTLIENSIAKRGPRSVYVRIKAPDGSLLTQSVTNLFDPVSGGAQLIYSAKREVDYNGEVLELCVFYKDNDFMPGAYNIEVFLDGLFVGSSQFTLK